MAFVNPFLSIAGQIERVKAVATGYKTIATNLIQGKLLTGLETEAKYKGTVIGKVSEILTKPITLIAAAIAPAAVIHAGTISTAAAPIVSKVTAAAVAKPLTAAAVVVGGLVVAKSSKAKEAIVNAPSSINKFTSNVANFVDNPSAKTGAQIYKDNPVLAGAITAGTAIVVGAGLTGVVSSAINTAAVRANTAATAAVVAPAAAAIASNPIQAAPAAIAPAAAITAAPIETIKATATPVTATTPTKKKKKKAVKKKKKVYKAPKKKKKAKKTKKYKKKKTIKKKKRKK
jgi:hypothetical protein